MHIDDFEAAVDRWGTNLDDWPSGDALSANALLAGAGSDGDKRAAHAALDAASALDHLFDHLEPHVTTAGLATRIQANVASNDRWLRLTDWFQVALWRPTVALAAPIALGFLIGIAVPPETFGSDEDGLQEELSWIAFATDYDSYGNGNGTNAELGDQP